MKIEKYFSWEEFLDYVNWQPDNADTASHDTSTEYRSWNGTKSFKHALNLAKYGWKEILNQIKQIELDDLDIHNNINLWESRYEVVGASVDIGRYNMGVPDCMMRQNQYINNNFHNNPKFVNIVVNTAYSANVGKKTVINHGIKVLNVMNTLEMNNVKTRIILLDNTQNQFHDLWRVFIKIKDFEDIFYLEKLLFPIAHPSFLRRLLFSAAEREPEDIRDRYGFCWGGVYGFPTDKFEYDEKNTLYFPHICSETKYLELIDLMEQIINDKKGEYSKPSKFDEHLADLAYKMKENDAPRIQEMEQVKTKIIFAKEKESTTQDQSESAQEDSNDQEKQSGNGNSNLQEKTKQESSGLQDKKQNSHNKGETKSESENEQNDSKGNCDGKCASQKSQKSKSGKGKGKSSEQNGGDNGSEQSQKSKSGKGKGKSSEQNGGDNGSEQSQNQSSGQARAFGIPQLPRCLPEYKKPASLPERKKLQALYAKKQLLCLPLSKQLLCLPKTR